MLVTIHRLAQVFWFQVAPVFKFCHVNFTPSKTLLPAGEKVKIAILRDTGIIFTKIGVDWWLDIYWLGPAAGGQLFSKNNIQSFQSLTIGVTWPV